jgi:GDP-L-fucose synthase
MPINIFIAGHQGMVGSAIRRQLQNRNNIRLITRERSKLDLTNQQAVGAFFKEQTIDQVYLAAARVGGIYANNKYPGEFIYQNLMIEANIIHAAHENNVPQLLFLGSSCIYPKMANQPIEERYLLSGELELTNEPYAIAKIAGVKLCESYNRQYARDYRSVMPTNLYGEEDNFHLENSHVIPALIRRFHEAKISGSKKVIVWGSGRVRREFLHVDDMAQASIFVMNLDKASYYEQIEQRVSHVNVGADEDYTISELSQMIAHVVGFSGEIEFDNSKPDGVFRKKLDVQRLEKLGWKAEINLKQGLMSTYQWFLKNKQSLRE